MIEGIKNLIKHLFLPRESNNHRARFLHLQALFIAVVFLIFSSFLIPEIRKFSPQILGVTNNISIDELLLLTNQKRLESGLSSLVLNDKLSQAASRKADDMFAKDYWAHNSPDGTTPWVFIKEAGYNYVYAGENLARGFSDSPELVDAWMASQTHKLNLLSENFEDVGFAVKTGELSGEETVLVVQEFGGRAIAPLAKGSKASPKERVRQTKSAIESSFDFNFDNTPLLNRIDFTSALANGIILFFIGVLIIDMVVAKRRKILRFVGHNLDHIFFLIIILGLIAILTKGVVI